MRNLLLPVALAFSFPVAAVQTFTGQTEGGAFYTIEAPDDWQPADGLVIYNHGFDIGPIETQPSAGVLSGFVQERGFAIAASSYSLNGWALFNTVQDNRELYAAVVENLGEPERVVVFGGSLGALVSVQAVEQGGIGNVVGAYPVCGPLQGSEVWGQALDLRLLYDVICDGVSGASIPGGASGLPYTLDPEQFDGILGELTATAIAGAVSACTGAGLPNLLRSAEQNARMDQLLSAANITEDFLPINMAYATVVLSDLVQDSAKLDGRMSLGNRNVDYGDPAINNTIERVDRDPFDQLFLKRNYTPTGRVGQTKLLITHTDKDDLVMVEHQRAYLQRVPAGQVSAAVVIDDEPGHCAYSEAELVAGWESLMEWVDDGPKPDAQSIQDRCVVIEGEGQYPGPCRYDPDFEIPPVEDRLRPRNDPEQPVDGSSSGSFFVIQKSGQGWFIQILENGAAVVYWFTYDPDGNPIWIGGTGSVLDNAIVFDESWTASGARFGESFDPADVVLEPWGSMEFLFTAEGEGQMEYAGPEGYGSGREPITQLTQIGSRCSASTNFSGLWFDPARNGEGIILEDQEDGRVFAAWFTYDGSGNPLWLYGEADLRVDGAIEVALGQFMGPRFGPGFDNQDLVSIPWGRMVLQLNENDSLSGSYASEIAEFGSGPMELVRLTRPVAAPSCSGS